ncbi:hypothetical protein RRG40_03655 [Mycoplasmopsis felis]|uniref:hypothetical protein n=1 Tax=Mycoplasmopsis felis TaxID=33923 RepID=UPI002AFE3F75|nr:hypothetical protein [Mycoplasmopsis felis]WQQ05786.1 hypothetical protein RRG59_01600 [Mycoplasmopsis felis]
MKIKFHSLINQNDNENIIEFESESEYSKEYGYEVFSFYEPSNNVRNRIEISNYNINIYAGSTTVFLEYQKEVDFDLEIENNNRISSLQLTSHWFKKEFTNNSYLFKYSLSNDNSIIGEYEITLTVLN